MRRGGFGALAEGGDAHRASGEGKGDWGPTERPLFSRQVWNWFFSIEERGRGW